MRRDEPFLATERRTLPGHAGALLRAVLRGLWRAVVVVMAVALFRHHQFGLAAMTLLVAAIAHGVRQWLGRFVVGVIVL
jgi:hypothetical protein